MSRESKSVSKRLELGVAFHFSGGLRNNMRIRHAALTPAVLQEVIAEFVTRDGTDHSEVEQRMVDVMRQLETGEVELHFDVASGTCNIVTTLH